MEDKVTEKVYCYNHPSACGNHDALAIAAMANRRDDDGNMMWPMMAMMGGGMNNWMNNPFAYMMMARMFGWNNGFGGDCGYGGGYGGAQGQQNIEMSNQLQAIRTQLNDNQNITLLRQAIGDGFNRNDFALSQLAQNLNVDFDTLQKCCCDVQAAIQQVAGQIGFSAERVINAVNMGDCNVIQALKDCCCTTQKAILEMGYQNQLAQKDSLAATQKGFCDLGFGMQAGFDRTNTGLERGFSQVSYDTQRQTCDIIAAGEKNTQRIIDTLNNHWTSEQALALQDEKFKNSQLQQNIYFRDLVQGRGNCGCGGNCGGCGCGQ